MTTERLNWNTVQSETAPFSMMTEGQSCSAVHVGCSDKHKVTITRTKLGWVMYCHKCAASGFSPHFDTVAFGVRHIETPSKSGSLGATPGGIWAVRTVPVGTPGREWLLKYGMDTWRESQPGMLNEARGNLAVASAMNGDLLFRMGSPIDGHAWVQRRTFNPDLPKWITYRDKGTSKHPCVLRSSVTDAGHLGGVILVEDIVSAMVVRKRLDAMTAGPRVDVASMNGLTLSWDACAWLYGEYRFCYLLADNDTAGVHTGGMLYNQAVRPLFGTCSGFDVVGNPSPKDATLVGLSDTLVNVLVTCATAGCI